MNNSKLLALSILALMLSISACKSTEVIPDGMPAPSESDMTDAMPADDMPADEPMVASSDVDVADLIAQHMEARGGADNIKAVQTVKMTGALQAMGMDMEMTNYIKRPNKVRAQILIKSMNMEVNQGFDGQMGWMQNPGSDPQPMPKEMTDGMKDQANIDGVLMDYAENGYTLEYMGEGTVNDSPAHKVKLIRPERPESIIYIDKSSLMEVKIDAEGTNPQTGEKVQTETYMSDYRTVDGIQMAHKIEVKMGGAVMQTINFETIELNVDVSDDLFMMPGMTIDIN